MSEDDMHAPLEILLLEDSDLDAELTGEYLRSGGIAHRFHRVWDRGTYIEALRSGPAFDLLLVDYVLPRFDGLAALEIAQDLCPHTPFIFLSGTLGEEVAIDALKRGATDYVSKQRLNRLCPAVTRAVAEAEQRAARRRAETELRELNRTLEARVEERTRALRAAKERIEAEAAEREQVEEQLRQAQKMEALGKLTGGVAHDFNNLLQVISGNLELLARSCEDDEAARTRLAAARGGVARGAKLAQQLLAFGRRQPLRPVAIDLGQLLEGQHEMLQRTLGDDVTVETEVPDGLWNGFLDPAQLENAILNLAINARDAMPRGGRLTISARNRTLDGAEFGNGLEPGDYVELCVADSGAGIPPALLDEVLEPFFTTKAEGHGTGLGLSMVYGFVKQSGGSLTIESEPEQGTHVLLYLPRHEGEAVAALRDDEEATVAGGAETILLVEDDAAVRATVKSLVEDLGYSVLEAANADEALRRLRADRETIDLLFTDVVMPGPMTSADLAAEARSLRQALPVLFTSGYTQEAMIPAGYLEEGVRLISKPYSRESLARELRHALTSEGSAPPAERMPDGSPLGGPLRILLVEDEVLIRMYVADMLQALGHEVAEADSLRAAHAIGEETEIDLLITDIGLPDGSGEDLARELCRRRPALRVIFASGRSSETPRDGGGAVPSVLLAKPFDRQALTRAMAAAMA